MGRAHLKTEKKTVGGGLGRAIDCFKVRQKGLLQNREWPCSTLNKSR